MSEKCTSIDLRELSCQQRHGLVFQCLSFLEPGYSLIITNDHDPTPLRKQVQARFGNTVSWDLEERGPTDFRITIKRLDSAPQNK